MSKGAFSARINEACDLLLGLECQRFRNSQAYGQPEISELRQMSYLEQWTRFTRDYAFDIQLVDLSLLQFRPQPTDDWPDALSFTYLGCPLEVLPYREWLIAIVGFTPETAAHVRDEYQDDYADYATTCDPIANPVYIRYDYSPHQYTANEHPAAHIHFGFDNQIRLGTRHLWNPMSFTLFVLRQVYPHAWRAFKDARNSNEVCKHVREHLPEVEEPLWCDDDEREASLL